MILVVGFVVLTAFLVLFNCNPHHRRKHRRARSFHYNVGPSRAKRGD